jgi:site-specific DNA-methyltransferase (adenine-specific)
MRPGNIRDSIVSYLSTFPGDASVKEIGEAVAVQIGAVSASSIRSYLNLNVPAVFERTARGRYRLKREVPVHTPHISFDPVVTQGDAALYQADCFDWLAAQPSCSIHAVVTDPPYGLVEYSEKEQVKLHNGKGGVWRIPPSFDGHRRAPLPRFTVLDEKDRLRLFEFFGRLGGLLLRVLVPGGNVVVASNPLLAHIVSSAMAAAGLEVRGNIVRLTMTMRGGDRPKNAHQEFEGVSVMPRSMWEPWVVLRRPLEGRVQDNLRRWKTGGFRRPSSERPFGDVIRSAPTPRRERAIAPHPSLKPQDFLRKIVRGVLPLGEGVVLDPFAGSGSTLAAANAVGYQSIGIEMDERYIAVASSAIERLGSIEVKIDPVGAQLFDPGAG